MKFFDFADKGKSSPKKKYPSVGIIFWIVFALVLLILFLVNRNTIFSVLKNTGFFTKVVGNEPEFIIHHEVTEAEKQPLAELEITAEAAAEVSPRIEVTAITSRQDQAEKNQSAEKPAETAKTEATEVQKPAEPPKTESAAKTEAEKPAAQESQKQEAKVQAPQMDQHLFFIQISEDGTVLRKESVRSIDKTIAPLTAAIKALLAGPSQSESDKGYISLIPAGTRLLGASVSNGVATINFSEEFRFNRYGVEGYYGQLMQVVYTACAFSNIESVQFLVADEKVDFLGEAGVYVGAPLSKGSFR